MKRLPRLSQSGLLTPAQWDSVAKVIEDNLRALRIQPGVGYNVSNSPGGASLSISPSLPQGGTPHPFQIMTTASGTSIKAGVYFDSNFFSNISPSSGVAITGLLSSFPADPSDSGWVTITQNWKFWLEYTPEHITTSPTTPASVVVKNSALSNVTDFDEGATPWDPHSVVEGQLDSSDLWHQTVARILLGTINYSTLVVDQKVSSNLMLQNFCISTYPASYPVPSPF